MFSMGYDFHITRKAFWADEDGPTISADEWLAIVESDSSLALCENGVNGPCFMEWRGSPQNPEQWLDYDADLGEIFTKYPDDALIEKMIEIAEKLGATVQGDDGEIYPQ